MAKLTAARRANLPASKFAIPGKGGDPHRYPIHDRPHAANALARVAQHGTPAEIRQVQKAVCAKYADMPSCNGGNGNGGNGQ